MAHDLYPQPTAAMTARREALAPEIHDAFVAFNKRVFADGALPQATKELIAVAVARPYCIRSHTRLAHQKGASDQQIMKTIWVAAELQAGGAYMHAAIALDALPRINPRRFVGITGKSPRSKHATSSVCR